MSFEAIPEDLAESYPCPECADGEVTLDKDGVWQCSECNFNFTPKEEE